jgi:hypothetical protein
MSRVRDFLKRVRGVSTPFGGLSWTAPPEEERADAPADGVKRFRAAIIYQGRVTFVEPFDFPTQLPWWQGMCALCVAAQAPQEPDQFRLLDIRGRAWLPQPAFSASLQADWIAAVDKDFAEQFRNDAEAVAEIIKLQRRRAST